MRLTKIVCTLGPASSSPDMIAALLERGMNVARINFSHGSHETHLVTINAVKEANAKHGRDVALMLDTKGPEIRTGDVESPIPVKKGEEILFTHDKKASYEGTVIHVNYPDFGKDVAGAESILVDNGELIFTFVKGNADGSVVLRAEQDGLIGNRRHVNLPGADVSLPSVTEQDWKDIAFGVEHEMDYLALSFVRTAEEIREVRAFLEKNKSSMRIVTKIETRASVENIDDIIDASDGIMVARGDLGAEMPFQEIPAVQDMIVAKCRAAGKPVIVATQMLESMIKNPMPTRAEVTDVAHAVITRADATMLSGESAAGKYPLQAVDAMTSIHAETESHLPECHAEGDIDFSTDNAVRAEAAVSMAHNAKAPAIVALCNTGRTVEIISQLRPRVPVYAFSDSPSLRRKLQLYYGIQPLPIIMESDSELNVERAMSFLAKKGLAEKGQRVVVLCRMEVRTGTHVTVHLRDVPQ